MPDICDRHEELQVAVTTAKTQLEQLGEENVVLFRKLDKLLEQSAANGLEIINVNRIVTNGMTKKLDTLITSFETYCTQSAIKWKEFDDFRWFRTLAFRARTSLIFWGILLLVSGLFILHFTPPELKKLALDWALGVK